MSARGEDTTKQAGEAGTGRRKVTYCVVPLELAPKLHELLREHFRGEAGVEVVVESRHRQRRRRPERRGAAAGERPAGERRAIRGEGGRRVADRRTARPAKSAPPLPRRARRHAGQLTFLERVVPTEEQLEDQDTARMVTRIQAGDREAYGDLYLRYFDRVYAYMKVALGTRDAEDATQQVFTQVLEAIPDYERRRQPFRAWLFAIARNYAVRVLRHEGRIELVDPAELGERLDEAALAEEQELPILDWIADGDLLLFVERMPAMQRQILTLRYMMGLGMDEIARSLHKSPEAIRRAHSRGLAYLRERLTAVGRGPKDRDAKPTPALTYKSQAKVLRARRYQLIDKGPVR